MSNAKPGATPPTRDPVSHSRALVEGVGILTPLAVIVAWLLTLLPIAVPEAVRNAVVGLIVAIGTLAFSEWRNRNYDLATLAKSGILFRFVPLLFALVVLGGCVTWDGATYKQLAGDEIVKLSSTSDVTPLDPGTCKALKEGAVALRNEEGDSKSLNAPFLAGQHIDELAYRHDRVGAICYEMEGRDRARGVRPEYRTELRGDWLRVWRNGRALQGGPEEEEE